MRAVAARRHKPDRSPDGERAGGTGCRGRICLRGGRVYWVLYSCQFRVRGSRRAGTGRLYEQCALNVRGTYAMSSHTGRTSTRSSERKKELGCRYDSTRRGSAPSALGRADGP